MDGQKVVSVENKTLWSVNSDVKTHVNFINQSKQSARAWWLDFSGHPVSYGDIRTSRLLRMDTFLSESLPHATQLSVFPLFSLSCFTQILDLY